MFNKKIFSMLVLTSLPLAPLSASALGLGKIEIKSALNQPLKAEIAVSDVQNLALDAIHVALAPKEVYQEVGVDFSEVLNSVKFQVLRNGQGEVVIQLSSDNAIKTPYANFLLDVRWPKGQLYREYELLLDPPVTQVKTLDQVQPQPTPEKKAITKKVESVDNNTKTIEQPKTQKPEVSQSYGPTTTQDHLWNIAQKSRPNNEVTIQQTMLAIVRKNPQAFISGNVNLLKTGQSLQIPSATEINTINTGDANSLIKSQDEMFHVWQNGKRAKIQKNAASKLAQEPTSTAVEKTEVNKTPITRQALAPENAATPKAIPLQDTRNTLLESNAAQSIQPITVNQNAEISTLKSEVALEAQTLQNMNKANGLLSLRISELETENKNLQTLAEKAKQQNEAPVKNVDSKDASAKSLPPVSTAALQGSSQSGTPIVADDNFIKTLLALLVGGLLFLVGVFWQRQKMLKTMNVDMRKQLEHARTSSGDSIQVDISKISHPKVLDPLEKIMPFILQKDYAIAKLILADALNKNPQRVDMHLKLLEIYLLEGDMQGFHAHYASIDPELRLENKEAFAKLIQ